MFRIAKPGFLQAFWNPYWRIPTAFLIISTISFLSYLAAPGRLDAVEGTIPDQPFGVELTETLIGLDLNDDDDANDPGETPQASGYTFTVKSVENSEGATFLAAAASALSGSSTATEGPSSAVPRGCRQNSLVQSTSALIWQAAKNEVDPLAYLVATPRHCLRWRKAFSTRWRSLYKSLS